MFVHQYKMSFKILWSKRWQLQGETDKPTIMIREFNTTLSIFDIITSQKTTKDIENLNAAINQLNLIDNYRSLNSTKEESIFFSSTYGTFAKIEHTLDHQ